MEKEKDGLPRERSYDDNDDDGNDDDDDEVATGASWKSVPGENMECPHLAQSVRFGDDNVDGSGCAVKDLPFVCAGRDSYKAPRVPSTDSKPARARRGRGGGGEGGRERKRALE